MGGGDLKAAARAAAAAKGQVVDVKFNVHAAGRREFTLYIMSDCWVSVDAVLPIHLKVQELSRAEKEGRGNRKVIALDEAGNPEGADFTQIAPKLFLHCQISHALFDLDNI